MKKLLLSIFALSSFIGANAQCSDIFISEYVEGSNNNKAIELYNPTNHAIGLNNNYRMIRYNNGTTAAAGEANSQAAINLGTHVMAPYSTWVIVIDRRDTTQTSGTNIVVAPGLRAIADTFLCYDYNISFTMNFNGNDAISLQKTTNGGTTWSYVDIFGMIGDAAMVSGVSWSDQFPYDGSVGAWWTLNHTLVRKSTVTAGVTVNPSLEFIVTAQWDSLPEDNWTNLRQHACVCFTGIDELDNSVNVKIFPNPSSTDFLNLTASEDIASVEIYNMVGQMIIRKEGTKTTPQMKIATADLTKGIYSVKLTFANNKYKVVKYIKQ